MSKAYVSNVLAVLMNAMDEKDTCINAHDMAMDAIVGGDWHGFCSDVIEEE